MHPTGDRGTVNLEIPAAEGRVVQLSRSPKMNDHAIETCPTGMSQVAPHPRLPLLTFKPRRSPSRLTAFSPSQGVALPAFVATTPSMTPPSACPRPGSALYVRPAYQGAGFVPALPMYRTHEHSDVHPGAAYLVANVHTKHPLYAQVTWPLPLRRRSPREARVQYCAERANVYYYSTVPYRELTRGPTCSKADRGPCHPASMLDASERDKLVRRDGNLPPFYAIAPPDPNPRYCRNPPKAEVYGLQKRASTALRPAAPDTSR